MSSTPLQASGECAAPQPDGRTAAASRALGFGAAAWRCGVPGGREPAQSFGRHRRGRRCSLASATRRLITESSRFTNRSRLCREDLRAGLLQDQASPIASPASPERAHPRHSQDVCRNTWRRLHETRFAPHFDFIGDFSRHFGLFEGCGSALDPMASGVVEALIYSLRDR